MDYEEQLSSYLSKHCHFIGIHKLADLDRLTARIQEGRDCQSSTTVFDIRSPYLTQSYYALLYRPNSSTIEWFDPLGMAPPPSLIDWCSANGFIYPLVSMQTLLSPDQLTWSGEFCAYFMKHRLLSVNMKQTCWGFFENRVPASINRVRREVDFSPTWGPPN
jgi:hypothetical protein